jgi:threonine dehydrogenase-like Zn-dependent dehydrogenase
MVVGGVTRDRQGALRDAVNYAARYPELNSALVTHRYGRAAIQEAFETAARPAKGLGKVVLTLTE